eukprot:16430272-Heterocapsa_arctica.AAC.1
MLWGDIYGQLHVGTPLYLQADSSPQFRRDYLVLECSYVRHDQRRTIQETGDGRTMRRMLSIFSGSEQG